MKRNEIIEGLRDPKDNPCWKGYKPVGTKKKGGKTVPNCVPNEGVEEGRYDRRDAYQRDYDSSISGMDGSDRREFKRREMEHELGHETNNYAVAIDGRTWKVFASKNHAQAVARSLQNKGKKATVHETGAEPTNEAVKKEPAKPRNFVAKNAKMGGAGQHKDKKKAEKQGDAKHKKPFYEQNYTADEMVDILSGKKTQAQVDSERKAKPQTAPQGQAPQQPKAPKAPAAPVAPAREASGELKVQKDDDKATVLLNPATGVQTQIDKTNPNSPRLTQDPTGKLKLTAPQGAQSGGLAQKPNLAGKSVEIEAPPMEARRRPDRENIPYGGGGGIPIPPVPGEKLAAAAGATVPVAAGVGMYAAGSDKGAKSTSGQSTQQNMTQQTQDRLGISLNSQGRTAPGANLARPAGPQQGEIGSELARLSGGEFATRADRLNKAKVDAILQGQLRLGPGYEAGSAAANRELLDYFRRRELGMQIFNQQMARHRKERDGVTASDDKSTKTVPEDNNQLTRLMKLSGQR